MRKQLLMSLAGFCCLAAVCTAADPAAELTLTDSRYQDLLQQLQPDREAPWLTIPWKIDLLDAQHQAAREHKPIFIWAMDGHPLGCT